MGDRLADIRQLVLDRTSGSASDPFYAPEKLDRAINSANKRLGRIRDWPWLLSIGTIAFAVGEYEYDLTTVTNYRATKYLSNGHDKLEYEVPSQFVSHLEDTGPIVRYTIVGNTLRVAATADEATTLDHLYVVDENDLGDDDDTPLLPAAYSELLVLATLKTVALQSKDAPLLNMARTEFLDAIREAQDEIVRSRQAPKIKVDESVWRQV